MINITNNTSSKTTSYNDNDTSKKENNYCCCKYYPQIGVIEYLNNAFTTALVGVLNTRTYPSSYYCQQLYQNTESLKQKEATPRT